MRIKKKKRIEKLEEVTEEEKTKMKNEIKKVKYVGESSRSGYDRGFEHLDKLATLSSNSHMLNHMVEEHYMEDFQDIRWGMFITRLMRSAFERQIEEAVSISREAQNSQFKI